MHDDADVNPSSHLVRTLLGRVVHEGTAGSNQPGAFYMLAWTLVLVMLAALCAPAAGQMQGADDTRWIAACVSDSAHDGESALVVLAYCACVNSTMDCNETRSIRQWEKANPHAQDICGKEAAWSARQ
jgi:hypothetical protein